MAGLADLDADRLKRMAAQVPGVKAVRDYRVLLRDPDIDAVAIAVPATLHYQVARAALLAGKHVYVEKPLAVSRADGEALVRLARARRRILMVGHILEYHPAVLWLRDMIRRGELGRILYVYSTRVNLGNIRSEENALWSLAAHDVAMILFLIGERAAAVQAVGGDYLQRGVEDVAFMTIRFPRRVLASVHVSWLDPHKVRKLTVVGSKKMAVFDDMEPQEKLRIFDKGVGDHLALRSGDIVSPRVDLTEPLLLECGHFVRCLNRGTKPRSDGEEGLRVLRVLDGAQKSMAHGSRLERL